MKTTEETWHLDGSFKCSYKITTASGIVKTDNILTKTVHSGNDHTLSESESLIHNKEQHLQNDYYKRLAETIKNYDEVILFGPTEYSKIELLHILKADHHFDNIKIEAKPSDRMTENQQHAFVKEHFSIH